MTGQDWCRNLNISDEVEALCLWGYFVFFLHSPLIPQKNFHQHYPFRNKIKEISSLLDLSWIALPHGNGSDYQEIRSCCRLGYLKAHGTLGFTNAEYLHSVMEDSLCISSSPVLSRSRTGFISWRREAKNRAKIGGLKGVKWEGKDGEKEAGYSYFCLGDLHIFCNKLGSALNKNSNNSGKKDTSLFFFLPSKCEDRQVSTGNVLHNHRELRIFLFSTPQL